MSTRMKRLPKWLDRAGFEADKLMRANRVRTEAGRIRGEADNKIYELGAKSLELAQAGTQLDPSLHGLASQIKTLHTELAKKEKELAAINAEVWVEPEPVAAPPTEGVAKPVEQQLQAPPQAPTPQQLPEADVVCPECGAVIRANATFCPRCGHRMTGHNPQGTHPR